MNNPNALQVETDDTPPIEQPKPEEQKESPDDQPIIPSLDELKPPTAATFNDAPDSTAPYGRDAMGTPLAPYGLKADGTPAKKRGRKTEGTSDQFERLDSVTPSTASRRTNPTKANGVPIAVDYRPLANLATGLWFGVPVMFLGDDWKPEPSDEPVISKAFYDYFKAKGISEMSPELGLAVALGGYTLVRLPRPTVKTRLGSFVSWLKTKANLGRFKRG